MERDQLLSRVHQLEREVELLRAELDPPNKRLSFVRPLQQTTIIITQYWVLFSVMAAIATAVYVRYRFNIDYFEEYRNAATTKTISEIYRQYGDRMLANSEWKAAEDAFRSALEVNPNNTQATYGMIKAQVFKPLEGEEYLPLDVAATRLGFLREALCKDDQILDPKGIKYRMLGEIDAAAASLEYLEDEQCEDYQVHYLIGIYYLLLGSAYDDEARKYLNSAISHIPDFEGSYLNLGYIEQRSFNNAAAKQLYEKVLELDEENALAYNNLGFLYLLELDYEQAITYLIKAYNLSPSLITAISLGDAYLYKGDFPQALQWHEFALDAFSQPGIENERYVSGLWLYNYMPLQPGDEETIKYVIQVGSLSQKQAILQYRLSFDYALKGEFEAADRTFATAQDLDPSGQYRIFFIYRIDSMINLLQMDAGARHWFETQRETLLNG